jgi:large subunit ribosomal protein L29
LATKQLKEIKNLTAAELATKVREIEKELFTARMKKVTGQLEDTASLWRMRKNLARAKTLHTQLTKGQTTA